ncbi:phytase [Sandaracinus amylolyticus]|uniref:phytase n=1 Tax=Sandaracinus amylolyticus TaxID=927083 RepID=UPI001F009D67|nr:phytase [Sandaracinus amylolyticus]UJR82568.1 Hypothetical protein I5071_46330 [Sandaracinus amylolyticus]
MLAVASALATCACESASVDAIPVVHAAVETEPSGGDPDDVAIWVDPLDATRSLVISTDKSLGFFVHDLEGRLRQSLLGSEPDNVDLRYDFELGDRRVVLLAAVDRRDDSITLLTLDETTHTLAVAPGSGISIADMDDPYGSCLMRSADGSVFVFVNAKSGEYRQYRLSGESGTIEAALVRTFWVESQPEGCVADDEHGWLYVGEEDLGVHRIRAAPDGGTQPELVDDASGGRLEPDIEGLAIYRTADGGGYLVVSSQGNDTYVVYERRPPNAFVTSFRIGQGAIDAATDTDGVEVAHADLGGPFREGLFVVQDDHNEGFTRNFKLVSWGEIAEAAGLTIDTTAPIR